MHALKSHLSRTAATVVAAVVLVAGLDMVAYAATGKSMLLGKGNSAGTTTGLKNTGRGAVLNLNGGALYPPLVVNSKKKVVNFNADTVDGLDATVLEPGVFKITMAITGSTPSSVQTFRRVSIPPGTYQAYISGIANNPTTVGAANGTITCVVADQETVFANPDNPNYAGLFAAQEDLATVMGGFALFGTSALFTVPAGHHVLYSCTSQASDGAVVVRSPIVATLRKISNVTAVAGTVWTPPAPRTAPRLVR